MSMWDPFELAGLPLSAYTPGLGDPKMEGGYETASGHPVYTFEQFLRGDAPYVTGATSRKDPSGQLVYRTMGDQQVPVRITDYGPKVQGIDIATSNKKWATNFPYQGATDKFTPPALAPPQAPQVAGPDIGARPAPLDLGVLGQFAVRNYGAQQQPGSAIPATAPIAANPSSVGPYQPGSLFRNQYAVGSSGYPAAMALPSTGDQLGGALGGILGAFGKSMSQQGQQGSQQAMAMLQRKPSAISALLDQLAANPRAYLQQSMIPNLT